MRVADVALLAEDIPQDEVGGFAAHTREADQFLHSAGDFAAEVIDQPLGAANDVPGLAVEEPAGVDVLAHFRRVRLCEALQGGETGVQRRCYLIYPGIGALGGEPHSEEQLVIFFVLQGTKGVRIDAFQRFNDAFDRGFGFHVFHLLVTGYHKIRQLARGFLNFFSG